MSLFPPCRMLSPGRWARPAYWMTLCSMLPCECTSTRAARPKTNTSIPWLATYAEWLCTRYAMPEACYTAGIPLGTQIVRASLLLPILLRNEQLTRATWLGSRAAHRRRCQHATCYQTKSQCPRLKPKRSPQTYSVAPYCDSSCERAKSIGPITKELRKTTANSVRPSASLCKFRKEAPPGFSVLERLQNRSRRDRMAVGSGGMK